MFRSAQKAKRVATVFLIGAAALTACSSATESSDKFERPKLTDSQTQIPASGVALPFDDFDLPYEELMATQVGIAKLASECMDARSLGDVPIVGDYIRPSGDNVATGVRFGTLTEDDAGQFGYHAAPGQPFSLSGGFYLKTLANISVQSGDLAVIANFLGLSAIEGQPGAETISAPAVGCLQEVEYSLDSKIASITDIQLEVLDLSYSDDRVKSAFKEWSRCMASAGYNYAHVEDPSIALSATPLSRTETETALADVECTRSSNWAGIYYQVLHAYQTQALEMQPDLFSKHLASSKALRDSLGEELGQGA